MSALDFPVSPGQQTPANYYTTDSGVTYFWNGSEWTLYGSPGFMPMAGSSAAMSGHIVLSGDPASAMHPATKNYVDLATGGSQSFTGNITLTGELHGPTSFIIDPSAIGDNTGTVIIKGNLQVDGDTTTINSATLTVDDKNIVLASGAADAAAANTAGITVDGANASLVYKSSGDKWVLNKVPYYNTARLLTTADEGTGNGLDADTVDGLEASAFSLTSHNHASTYLQLSGGTLSGNIGFSGTQTVDGYDISALGSKLAGIENSADVTDAANVGSAGAVMYADTDVTNMSFVLDEDNFSSNSNTKTATQQSIKAYVDVQTGVTNLSTAVAATSVTINSDTGTNATIAAVDGSNAGVMTNALFTKLSGIETGATADQTNAEIRAAIAAASDSNVFTDNEQTKLTGIASGAEVNVQSDWDATSGDAFIQNKPSLSFLLSAGGNLTGNLGINKVSPSSTLDIYNNTTNAAIHTLGPSTDTSYNYILSGSNDSGIRAVHFVNNSNKTSDGGADSYTIRNDGGALILGKSNQNTVLQGSTLKHGSDVILTASNIGTYASGAAHNHDSVYFKKTGGSLSGELSLSYDAPQIKLIDTGGSYYWLFNDDNEFRVRTNYGTGTSASGNDPLILINSSETGKLYNNAILTSANYNSYALPLTGGSISGNLTVDTNVLHVNTTDNRVGIGLINPASALEVSGVITLNNRIQLKEGTVDKAYIAWDDNTDTLDLVNEATDEYLSIGSGLSGLGYTAESISYIVYHEGNLTLDTLGYAACRGWAPTYGNNDAINTITWSSIDDAVGLTVGNGGMAYKAIRMNNGEDLDIQVTFKGSAADTDGISFRLYFYQGDLPDGKTHVGESTSDSLVEEYSGGTSDKDTTWYEDDEIWADWANQGHIFTAPADGYVSLVVLNLTGFTGTIHVKEPQYQVYRPISDATDSSSSTQAASSTAVKAAYDIGNHSHPYLSNTTTFNTVIGTDSNINTTGATIIDNLSMTDGVITSHGTRTLTLGNLGYTVSVSAGNNTIVERDNDGDIEVGDIYCGDVYATTSNHEVWHAGNLTNVSQLTNNAGYVTPSQVSVSAGNDTIVKRHSSGYIYTNYFHTTPNDVQIGTVTKVCVETGDDGFIRHGNAGAIRTFLGIESGATADQTAAEILTAINTLSSASFTSPININGGTANGANDATLYVTATDNSDWGLIVDKYNGSATEYGVQIDVASSSSYALRVMGNNSEVFRVSGNGTVTAGGSNTVWHAGNLTNVNQLSNGPGYYSSGSSISASSLTASGQIFCNGAVATGGSSGAFFGRNHAYSTVEIGGYGAEFMMHANSTTININYRYCNNKSDNSNTPQNWYWRDGTSTGWSAHHFGAITANGAINATGNITGTEVYATSWLRNSNNNYGLYNENQGRHFYCYNGNWRCNTDSSLIMESSHNGSVWMNCAYNSSNGTGLLMPNNWWLCSPDKVNTQLCIGGHLGSDPSSSAGIRLMLGGGNQSAQDHYYIGTNINNYGGSYTKLDIAWHTGIRIGAHQYYGGIRFFHDQTFATQLMSIGEGDDNVRVAKWIYQTSGYGLYNSSTSTNWMSNAAGEWTTYSSQTYARIKLCTGGQDHRGSLYATSSNDVGILDYQGTWRLKIKGIHGGDIWLSGPLKPDSNGSWNLGGSSWRWKKLFATNATNVSSDRALKQDIEELDDKEKKVAVVLKTLIRKYRLISEVQEEGDKADYHIGVIAQDVTAAFEAEGLDANNYGLYTDDMVYEDIDGKECSEDEAATSNHYIGIAYSELLAFIISAM